MATRLYINGRNQRPSSDGAAHQHASRGCPYFVKERKTETSEGAAKLADDYWQARKSNCGDKRPNFGKQHQLGAKHCQICGKPGHLANDHRKGFFKSQDPSGEKTTPSVKQGRGKKDLKEIECFNCHQKGHYVSNCPQRALFCMERQMDHKGQSIMKKSQVQDNPGMVEGKPVKSILLDTGCSRTLVWKDLVLQHKLIQGEV